MLLIHVMSLFERFIIRVSNWLVLQIWANVASPGRLYSTSCHCIFFTHATLDRQEPPPAFNIAKRPYQTSALELLPDLNPDRSLVYQSELVSRAASSVHSRIFLGAS